MFPFFRLAPVPDPAPDAATGPIRIVLADDHAVMRQSLRVLLDGEADLDVIAETDSLGSVIGHVRARRPDVLVLDLGMPDQGSGMEALARLSRELRDTNVVVLTTTRSSRAERSTTAPSAWCSRRWPTPTCPPQCAGPGTASAI
jgi:chemotaxis response regulator CheB